MIAYKIDCRCPALHISTNLYKIKLSYVTISILASVVGFSLNYCTVNERSYFVRFE
jgi:hypothetical protein